MKSSQSKKNTEFIKKDLESAIRVTSLAANGLIKMGESFGANFSDCIDLLSNLNGRVVVSGMGKSGHVGNKIAATLASTGTQAFFVHPAEASHGDLGMISEEDAVIALSNSGETKELSDLMSYTRRFNIPLIGITSVEDSTLAENSDILICLPDVEEAGPHGVPTTSTTLMISLGDSIAVALLERRGFSSDDYRLFHPGGKLGKSLLKVADLMHAGDEVPLTTPETLMSETIIIMTNKTFGVAGVVDEKNSLIGIVTDGDLRRHMSGQLTDMKTSQVMTSNPKSINPNILASEALRIMNASKVTCLFVIDNGSPVGIIRIHDILRAGVA
ncbi:MAG: KpsF/GutQ family sugar-phosphate isomerase [Alphaproteobacteria bacterium TMED87]|nr:MAG: KpsF/GutQ family sugar-phosphate isomerase [Alphaproteobacteria bacterium TMED87]|tara:strand:- start:216 stop:1202 length:987 start_codon:yes stop_codon:yes gene_type:complete